MRASPCLAFLLASMAFAPASPAQDAAAYAIDYDRLYQVDLASREASLIGSAGQQGPQLIGDLSGLATTIDGNLYAVSDTVKSLLHIDPASGSAQVVGGFDNIAGADPNAPLDLAMAASCDGGLWMSSAVTGELWQVDPDTATTTLVGSFGSTTITGLVAYADRLYGIGGRGDESLYRIDPDTAALTPVGDGFSPVVDYIASASPAITSDGTMLVVLNYVPPPPGVLIPADWSDLASIDLDTGEISVLGPITGPDSLRGIGLRGFTLGPPQCSLIGGGGNLPPTVSSTPVPASSPWALLLEALAVIAAVWLVRRQSGT